MTWFVWLCQRCGDGFRSQTVTARDCPPCAAYAANITGRPMPAGEMGGE